jgi:hypothetical protein
MHSDICLIFCQKKTGGKFATNDRTCAHLRNVISRGEFRMMTGKSVLAFAVAIVSAFSLGSMAAADDAIEFQRDRYVGDETGGTVSATGKVNKNLILQGGVVNVTVNFVVEQTVADLNLVETTKTQDVQVVVPVTLVPRYNPKKKLLDYTFVVPPTAIAPISLVGTDETAVTDPMIILVDLVGTVSINNNIVATESEDLFDYYDTDDDDDDDDH